MTPHFGINATHKEEHYRVVTGCEVGFLNKGSTQGHNIMLANLDICFKFTANDWAKVSYAQLYVILISQFHWPSGPCTISVDQRGSVPARVR